MQFDTFIAASIEWAAGSAAGPQKTEARPSLAGLPVVRLSGLSSNRASAPPGC
jgi:hypothetical protein